MNGDFIVEYWPQITALLLLVFWISRTISEMKGHNESQDERLRQIDKKIEQLFDFWNDTMRRQLDRLERYDEKNDR